MSYLDLLRKYPDFRKLFLAALISFAGDWFLTVALLDLVLDLTGSATLAALMIVAQSLPVILATPLAGHLVDTLNRRTLMIVLNLIAMGAALLPLLAVTPKLLVFGYLGMILITICAGIIQPALSAAVPNLVETEDLAKASVLFGTTWGSMLVIGAALGGFVTATFGRDVSFLIDALTFAVSAWFLVILRRPLQEARGEAGPKPGMIESFGEVYRWARDYPRSAALVTAKGGYGFGAGVVAMLSIFGREVFQAGANGIGMLFAARGLGALVGPFIVKAMSRSAERQYRTIPPSAIVFGLGYAGLALSPNIVVGVVAVTIAHLGGGALWLTSTYGLQNEVPDFIRGRFFAVDFGLVTLAMGLSSTVAGVLADRYGAVMATLVISTLCLAFAIVWGILTRGLWNGERDAIRRPDTTAS